ncbi:hypothetical protein BEWA_037660 [Theileria equi strain WA]|uniref:Ion transport domain-containing protein n=1 Tax=Theileria equi strain WA TaxID=1537102 RepID=L1LEQ3_THEEQ|nr:hypothetical protein BEWA_037660 [Theileria equi strain WA]EKX73730.1 hypothetical protein BEWA_037660 [Theileria equi strain WA]|eukprot:XP_004833182.1 hypothetical protein BEWA_037660 [Theileria equi strain WA]
MNMGDLGEDAELLPNKKNKFNGKHKNKTFVNFDFNDDECVLQESNDLQNKINQFGIKLFYSDITPKVYMSLFSANVLILIASVLLDDKNVVSIFIEILITLIFALEIYINYILHGPKYYTSFEGCLDTAMVSLCLAFIIVDGDIKYLLGYRNYASDRFSDFLEITICVSRLIIQTFRLIRFFARHRRAKVCINTM